jgi:DNA-binding transcriptional LysR family regulator
MNSTENMRVFVHVVAEGGFSAAAKRMNVSTARVSRSISELESHLSVRLLNRTTRRIVLTEAGARYLERCKQILDWLDLAEAEARAAPLTPSGTLRLYAILGFSQSYIVPAVLRFRERQPSVNVELTFSEAPLDLIESGYDTAFVLAPSLPDSGLIANSLGSMHCIACASPSYVQNRGAPHHAGDLNGHTFLQLDTPPIPGGIWMLAGREIAEKLAMKPFDLTFNHESPLLEAMLQGLGIGLLPAATALPALQSGELVPVLRGVNLQILNVYAVYPSREFIDAKIRAWIDFLREFLPPALATCSETLKAFTNARPPLQPIWTPKSSSTGPLTVPATLTTME